MPRILKPSDISGFRDRLCDAAAAFFVEKGPSGFTMRELASRLGVSPMTPYRYFKDKDEILAAVRARAIGQFADYLATAHTGSKSAHEKIAELGLTYVKFALDEQTNYRLMFATTGPWPTPQSDPQERRALAVMIEFVRDLAKDGVLDGDPGLVAQAFWASLHGAVVLHLAGELDRPELERLLPEIVGGFLKIYGRPIEALREAPRVVANQPSMERHASDDGHASQTPRFPRKTKRPSGTESPPKAIERLVIQVPASGPSRDVFLAPEQV